MRAAQHPQPDRSLLDRSLLDRSRLVVLGLALAGLALSTVAAAAPGTSTLHPLAALELGNELHHEGRLEEAVEVYRDGWSAERPHPTLVYNLATTLHHLDRLPEAVLWYRRGDADDPWLQENLWLARRSLGSQTLPPVGPAGWLARHRGTVAGLGIVAAWATLLALALPRVPRGAALTAALVALALYAAGWSVERWGPRPGVLLEPCGSGLATLPAGTEAWVRPADGGWTIPGVETACPAETVAPVAP